MWAPAGASWWPAHETILTEVNMRGMHRMNRLFFFLFTRGSRRMSPQYHERQARLDAALKSLQVKTQEQIEHERKIVSAGFDVAGGRDIAAGGGSGIPVQPQGVRPDAHDVEYPADGSHQTAKLTGHYPNWETLEEKLQEIARDNPDISEVELDE